MKRDMDLIRAILLKIEDGKPNTRLNVSDFVTENHGHAEVSEHIKLLIDANYIETFSSSTFIVRTPCVYEDFLIERMTMYGYDFIDSIRSESVWEKTKEKIKEKGPSASLDIIMTVAKGFLSSQLGI